MALSGKTEGKVAGATAPKTTGAPIPAPTPAKVGGDSARKDKMDAFKAAGHASIASMSEDQKAALGSGSGKLKFLHPLGDPQSSSTRTQNKESGIKTHVVVGYSYEVLEDIEVPTCKMTSATIGDILQAEKDEWRLAKKGEVINLTLLENGLLLSTNELSGRVTGGGMGVTLEPKASDSRLYMLPTMKKDKGSIKENMVLIGDNITGENGRTTYKCKDEYAEKFGILFTKKPVSRRGAASQETINNAIVNAQSFKAMWAAKGFGRE